MSQRDNISSEVHKLLLATTTTTTGVTTPTSGASIDTRGFDAASLCLHLGAAVSTGSTVPSITGLVVSESDDNSTFTVAPSTSLNLSRDSSAVAYPPAFSKSLRIGYVGNKRYIKMSVKPTGPTRITITGHLSRPAQAATANPA